MILNDKWLERIEILYIYFYDDYVIWYRIEMKRLGIVSMYSVKGCII